MGHNSSCRSSSRTGSLFLKVLLGAAAMVGIVCLLLVAGAETMRTQRIDAAANFKHGKAIGGGRREKFVYDPELDNNYMMSKRRVPNGPDPIHNRRAGNSKRPPGQD